MKVFRTFQHTIVAFLAAGLAVGILEFGSAQAQGSKAFKAKQEESTKVRLGPFASTARFAGVGKRGSPQIDITGYFVGGSHCQLEGKESNADLSITSTYPEGPRDNFQLTFDSFALQPGHYGNPKNASAIYGHCLVELDIDIPKGYRISYLRYDVYGSLDIGLGGEKLIKRRIEQAEVQTMLRLESRAANPEMIAASTHSLNWSENVAEDFVLSTGLQSTWQGCTSKARLSILTSASLSSRSILDPESWISVETSDGQTGESIYVRLSPCSEGPVE